MRATDLPPDLQRKILGKVVGKAAPKPEENEGENLFRFQIKALELPAPREQYPFAQGMGRKFAADFAWPEFWLIVEIFGGIYLKGGGAHSRPAKIETDMERMQYAGLLGFRFLPFTPDDVFSGHAINWTEKTLRAVGWRPAKL